MSVERVARRPHRAARLLACVLGALTLACASERGRPGTPEPTGDARAAAVDADASNASQGDTAVSAPEDASLTANDAPAADVRASDAHADQVERADAARRDTAPAPDVRPPDARPLRDGGYARWNGMVWTYTAADGTAKPLPECIHSQWKTDLGCPVYCGCWFDKGHCTTWPATVDVYATPNDCMRACEAFVAARGLNALGCHADRTDNNDFHCPKGVLGARCP